MDYRRKKLLILGGSVLHCKVVKAAKEMGIYTIVTDNVPFNQSPAKQMADKALMINVLDVDGITEWCKMNPVDGVINFCIDIAQTPQQQICERLGLPSYGSKEQYFALTNKSAFKKMCQDNGVDIIQEYYEDDIENGTIEYPVLVKPVDSRGSRGQTVCSSKEELIAALLKAKSESISGKAIIEKYMAGKQDFSVGYLIKKGKVYLVRINDRYLGKIEDGLERVAVASVAPSANADVYFKKTHNKVIKMFENLGLQNAIAFMQGFVDEDTIRFYDPGIRFPGTEYEQFLLNTTGVDLMKYAISFVLGEGIDDYDDRLSEVYLLNDKTQILLFVHAKGGKIAVFDGLNEIVKQPEILCVTQRYFVGDVVPQTGDVRQRICEIVILTEKDKIQDTAKKILGQLDVRDEAGNNMLVSLFDPSVVDNRIGI